MPLISRLGLSLTCSLLAGLSTPFIAPAIFPGTGYANAQAPSAPFSDVSADYWATEYIEGLARLNVISGFSDGTFKPNDSVTRAQFAAILHQAFLQSQPTTAQSFVDVPAGYWAADDIYAARAAGFLAGYPDTTFRPDDPISKSQALISLANGLDYTAGNLAALSVYENEYEIVPWARPSLAAATEANLVVNYPYPRQFAYYGTASRADVAAYVYQALVKEGRAEHLAIRAERRWQSDPIVTIESATEQMSLSGSGQEIATIPIGGTKLQIWNAQTGALLKEISADGTRFNSVTMSQDGTKVAAVNQNSPTRTIELSVWSVETGDRLWQRSIGSAEGQPPHTALIVKPSVELAFNLNDSQIVTQVNLQPEDAELSVYDAVTGNTLQSLDFNVEDYKSVGAGINLQDLTLSADGSSLATIMKASYADNPGATQYFQRIWQLDDNGRFIPTYASLLFSAGNTSDISFTDMVFTNSGFFNFLTGNYIEGGNQLDTTNLQIGMDIAHTVLPDSDRTDFFTRLSPDGEYYFVRGDVAGSRLGNVRTGEVQNLGGDEQDTAAMFSRNGDYLAVASPQKIRIFSKKR